MDRRQAGSGMMRRRGAWLPPTPSSIFGSDLIAWYRGDQVTVSEPSPLDPHDLTTANWLRNNTTVVADQYTSTYDGVQLDKVTANAVVATPTYVESAVAIANCNANFPNTVRICRAKYGNHAWIMLGGGTKHAYFNLQTGVVGTVNGGGSATITALGGGEYLCKYFAPTAGVNNKSLVHLVSGDNASINWSPAGTEYIYMAGVYMEQKRVSAWPDLSGQANHITQATAVNQPTYVSGSDITFDGSDDSLFTAGFAAINGAPAGEYWSIHTVGTMTALGAKAGAQRIVYINTIPLANGVNAAGNDWESLNSSGSVSTGAPDTSLHLVSNYVTANGVGGLALAVDGTVIGTGTAAVGGAGGYLIMGAGNGASVYTPCSVREVVVAKGLLTPTRLALLKSYFRSRHQSLVIA